MVYCYSLLLVYQVVGGGCLFWGWLVISILHIPVEAVVLPLALIGLNLLDGWF